jgi:hypothetical protein
MAPVEIISAREVIDAGHLTPVIGAVMWWKGGI